MTHTLAELHCALAKKRMTAMLRRDVEAKRSRRGKVDAWDAAYGIAPDATGDLSSEESVRQLRDEWERT